MNISDIVKSVGFPVHKEGYPFIAIFLLVTLLSGWLWMPLFYTGLVLTVWCALFFRNPKRVTPVNDDWVISPADGVISHIAILSPPDELKLGSDPVLRISIFMSVFNCHVNRIPMSGKIVKKIYHAGAFFSAEQDKASQENERNSLIIETSHGKIAVTQIAGLIARRIVCWVHSKQKVEAGRTFGLIRFGSRLDVYLPETVIPQVAVGQTMIAGESVIAAFDSANAVVHSTRTS